MLVQCVVGFPQVAHVMCMPILLAFVCALSQTSHLFPVPGLSRQGSSSRWYSLEISWIGKPSTPILDGLNFWESLKLMGKSLYFMGKSLELLKLWMGGTFEALMSFLWKNLLLGKFGIGELECQFFIKIWVGKSCWEYPYPSELGNFVCHVGSGFENVPVAKFVWNIGETFENFNLGKLLLGILLNLLKISSWEHLVKFLKILFWKSLKFGIFICEKSVFVHVCWTKNF